MLKKIKENKSLAAIIAIFAVYAVIHAATLLFVGDDVIWQFETKLSFIFSKGAENSRYFTNAIMYFMVNSTAFRIIVMTLFTMLLPFTIGKLSGSGKIGAASFIAGILVWFSIPQEIAQNTVNWLSGFTNYIIGTTLVLTAIIIFRPLLDGKDIINSPKKAAAVFLLGAAGSMCVENITIFACAFGVFLVILSAVRYKKPSIAAICYTFSSLIGAALIALNSTYSSLMQGNADDYGDRSISIDFFDILQKLYVTVMPEYSHKYFLVHIVITASVAMLYLKKVKLNGKHAKYGKLMLSIVIAYTVFTFYSYHNNELISMTAAHRTDAILTAFAFLYLVGLTYLLYQISPTDFPRRCVTLVGTIILTAPFTVVSPLTPRCLFPTYIFWGVTAADLLVTALETMNSGTIKAIRSAAVVTISTFCALHCFIAVSNKYVDVLRADYIKTQLAENKKIIECIMLPYPNYAIESMAFLTAVPSEVSEEEMESETLRLYRERTCDHYGIDHSFLDKRYLEISIVDYFTYADS